MIAGPDAVIVWLFGIIAVVMVVIVPVIMIVVMVMVMVMMAVVVGMTVGMSAERMIVRHGRSLACYCCKIS